MGEDYPDFSAPDEIKGVPNTEIYSSLESSDKSVNPVPATTTTDEDANNLAEPDTENNVITNETVENEIEPAPTVLEAWLLEGCGSSCT